MIPSFIKKPIIVIFLLFVIVIPSSSFGDEVLLRVTTKPYFAFVVRKIDFIQQLEYRFKYSLRKNFALIRYSSERIIRKEREIPHFGIRGIVSFVQEKRYEYMTLISPKRNELLKVEFDFSNLYKRLDSFKLRKNFIFERFRTSITHHFHFETQRVEFFMKSSFFQEKAFSLVNSSIAIIPTRREEFSFGEKCQVKYHQVKNMYGMKRLNIFVSNGGIGGNMHLDRFHSTIELDFWKMEEILLFIPINTVNYNLLLLDDGMRVGISHPKIDFEVNGLGKAKILSLLFPINVMNFNMDVGISSYIKSDGIIPFPIFSLSLPINKVNILMLCETDQSYGITFGLSYNKIYGTLLGKYSFIDGAYSFLLNAGYIGDSFGFSTGFGEEYGEFFGRFEITFGPLLLSNQSFEMNLDLRMMENLKKSELKFEMLYSIPVGALNIKVGGNIGIIGGEIKYGGNFEISF